MSFSCIPSRAPFIVIAVLAAACGDGTTTEPLEPSAAALSFIAHPTGTAAGNHLAPAVQVEILDPSGTRVPDATDPVTVALGVNPAGGTLLGTVTVDAVEGVATFPDLSIEQAGSGYRIEVSSGSLEGALGDAFDITAAAPSALAFLTQPGTVEGQVPFEPVEVAVQDAYGNRVTEATEEIGLYLSGHPPSALGGNTVATAVAGVATFTDITLAVPGEGFVLRAQNLAWPPVFTGEFDVRLTFVQETAGGHTCALTAAGFAYCWGSNVSGQLGDGTASGVLRETLTPVAGGLSFAQVSAGTNHTCGVTTDNDAYCWGLNNDGQLGDGTTERRETPTLVSGGLSFVQVSTGNDHTCGLTTDNVAYCWGWNGHGRLGDGTTEQRGTPTPVTGGLNFTQVSAGAQHTCGLTAGNFAYCWGRNFRGELGDGTTTQRTVPTPVMGGLSFTQVSPGENFHTCGVTTGNDAYCWGLNDHGRLGDGTTTQRAVPTLVTGGLSFAQVSAGHRFTCGLTTGNVAYCWGFNGNGQLGDGTTTHRDVPTPVAGGPDFAGVSTGREHSCALTAGNVAYCWGWNGHGQLGDGTTNSSSTPRRVHH